MSQSSSEKLLQNFKMNKDTKVLKVHRTQYWSSQTQIGINIIIFASRLRELCKRKDRRLTVSAMVANMKQTVLSI